MSEQSNNKPSNSAPGATGAQGQQPQQRRPNHNNRRRHHNANNNSNKDVQKDPNRAPGPQQSNQNPNNRRRPQHHHNNRPRPQNPNNQSNQQRSPGPNTNGGFNIERIYEKYLNLLDQHLIARRKYHDMFYRADPNQKIKLEKNFYNTLNDIREFESRLAPDVRDLFEKRNNGLAPDRIYTQNHALSIEGDPVPTDLPPAEPHLLQSQIAADFSHDSEESVGTADDYLKYKNLL